MGNTSAAPACVSPKAQRNSEFTRSLITDQLYTERRYSSPTSYRRLTNNVTRNHSPCLCKHMDMTPSSQNNKELRTMLCQQNQWGLTPLHLACELGNADLVHILLHFGVTPNLVSSVNHGYTTALILAASGGHADCVQLLLQFGADVNQTDCWGNCALYKAACYNFVECVDILLQSGAKCNLTNKWGALPLQYAALQGYDEIVALLLQHGADVQMWGEASEPQALTAAVIRGHVRCVELLLRHGTPVKIPGTESGFTPLENLLHFGTFDSDCLSLLLEYGAEVTPKALTLLHKSCNMLWFVKYKPDFLTRLLQGIPSSRGYETELMVLVRSLAQSTSSNSVQLIKQILDLGLAISHSEAKSIEEDSKTNADLLDSRLLSGSSSKPRDLAALCRMKVRESLGSGVQDRTRDLPIPVVVKDFVKLLH